MEHPAFSPPSAGRGRPRLVELTDDQGKRLAEIYLATNRTRKEGSMEAAWVLFCESEKVFLHTVKHHRLVGALPTAALEWMRRAKGLVVAKRGGAKELRLKGPYQHGGMRTHWSEGRRLRAGESYSVDDLTRNVAVWIPWPHGGCACSEKYGVRLGRWQTLVVCDDATYAVPSVSSVFRYAASYQGADAASLIYQTERNVGMAGFGSAESRWVVEGGVWQSNHALAALAGRFHSAKGRPMQKLIERWFGAVQTLDAVWNRDLGRQRGEILENNQLWLDCRAGKKDPREHFASFEAGQQTLMHAIAYMNEREVRSDTYGNWVPQERWDRDVAEHPLAVRDEKDSWVMMPERRSLKVSRAGMLSCKAIAADGVSRSHVFNAPFLYEHMGRRVDLYFDPLGEWPIEGIITEHKSRRVLGTAVCQNPFGASRDADRERVAAVRRTMLTDLRVILGGNAGARRTTGRGIGGTIEISSDGMADEIRSHEESHRSEGDRLAGSGEGGDATVRDHEPRRNGGGVPVAGERGSLFISPCAGDRSAAPADDAPRLRSLSRKAKEAREQTQNW